MKQQECNIQSQEECKETIPDAITRRQGSIATDSATGMPHCDDFW